MKLNTLHRQLPMTHAHDLAVLASRSHLDDVRAAFLFDDEGVIARGFEGFRQTLEYPLPSVADHRGLSMHDRAGANDLPPIGHPDGLVAQADTENRNAPTGKTLDARDRNASVIGNARPGLSRIHI